MTAVFSIGGSGETSEFFPPESLLMQQLPVEAMLGFGLGRELSSDWPADIPAFRVERFDPRFDFFRVVPHLLVVRPRLAEALADAFPGCAEYLPMRLAGHEEVFALVNLLQTHDVIDLDRSEIHYSADDRFEFVESSLSEAPAWFRDSRKPSYCLTTDRRGGFKQWVEARSLSGVAFHRL